MIKNLEEKAEDTVLFPLGRGAEKEGAEEPE